MLMMIAIVSAACGGSHVLIAGRARWRWRSSNSFKSTVGGGNQAETYARSIGRSNPFIDGNIKQTNATNQKWSSPGAKWWNWPPAAKRRFIIEEGASFFFICRWMRRLFNSNCCVIIIRLPPLLPPPLHFLHFLPWLCLFPPSLLPVSTAGCHHRSAALHRQPSAISPLQTTPNQTEPPPGFSNHVPATEQLDRIKRWNAHWLPAHKIKLIWLSS